MHLHIFFIFSSNSNCSIAKNGTIDPKILIKQQKHILKSLHFQETVIDSALQGKNLTKNSFKHLETIQLTPKRVQNINLTIIQPLCSARGFNKIERIIKAHNTHYNNCSM